MTDAPYVALQTVMMPADLNPQGTIFGGVILGLIDMAAYIGTKRLVIQAGGPVPVLVNLVMPWAVLVLLATASGHAVPDRQPTANLDR